jgi:hypothetical protein
LFYALTFGEALGTFGEALGTPGDPFSKPKTCVVVVVVVFGTVVAQTRGQHARTHARTRVHAHGTHGRYARMACTFARYARLRGTYAQYAHMRGTYARHVHMYGMHARHACTARTHSTQRVFIVDLTFLGCRCFSVMYVFSAYR